MKKLFACGLAVVIALGLAACGGPKEVTKLTQIKDLEKNVILEVGEQTRKDIEKFYGQGVTTELGSVKYEDDRIWVKYDDEDVAQIISIYDPEGFETLKYQPGMTAEEAEKQFEHKREATDGFVTLSGTYSTEGLPCYFDAEDALCSVFITYLDGAFRDYFVAASDLEGKETSPAGAYQADNTITEANMKAATQAVQVTDQMLDFEITAEEAAKQLERLSNRMEKGNTKDKLVSAEVDLLAIQMKNGAYNERHGGVPDDQKILETRNKLAQQIGMETR